MAGLPKNNIHDVWARVDRRAADECWPWFGTVAQGYGVMRVCGRYYKAHRVAYASFQGGIDLGAPRSNYEEEFVLHRCDNPLCCNPAHLYLGDIWANMKDKVERGRQHRSRGELHKSSKVRNADAVRIREALLFGAKPKDLAEVWGVKINVIYGIKEGKTYRDSAGS